MQAHLGPSAALLLLAAPAWGQTPPALPPPPPVLDLDFSVVPRACPEGEDEIVVCGRRPERSPYRIPEQPDRFDPHGPVMSVSRERNALSRGATETGMMTCTNVGPYGWMGCAFNAWRDAREQHGK